MIIKVAHYTGNFHTMKFTAKLTSEQLHSEVHTLAHGQRAGMVSHLGIKGERFGIEKRLEQKTNLLLKY